MIIHCIKYDKQLCRSTKKLPPHYHRTLIHTLHPLATAGTILRIAHPDIATKAALYELHISQP